MMAAMGEVNVSETRNDDSKQIGQENYQVISKLDAGLGLHQSSNYQYVQTSPTTTSTTPQENEDFKGLSENLTQLSGEIEGDGSVDKTISTSQLLQNHDGNISQSNVNCEYTFPVTESITVPETTKHGICQSQQEVQQSEVSMEDKPSSYDPADIGHNTTEGKSQFPIVGKIYIKPQTMEETRINHTENTMFDNEKSQEMLHSQTTENLGVTSLDSVHHEDQEVEKGVNSEADTSILVSHNAGERELQFPLGEKLSESQKTDEAKTNQSTIAVFNSKSIQQTSSSQTTQNSHVWENLKEFGEFRLQRRVSTIPTIKNLPSHTRTKEELHLQQRIKEETEQSISDEHIAVFLAGTLTSQDTNKIIKAAENPDSEELLSVTFGRIYFIISTNLEMSKIMTLQDDKDFEAPSENSSQLCKISSTNEDASVDNITITTRQLLPDPDGTTNQNILACSKNITMAHEHEAIEKTDVRICQSQQGQQSEQILECMSQIQTVHRIKSPDMPNQLSYQEAAASNLTSEHDSLQTPIGDEAQPQEIGKQMSCMPITRTASILYQTEVTNLDYLHDSDQETEREVNFETDILTDHKEIHVSESKAIHQSESTNNIHQIVKKSEDCVDDKTSSYDPVIAGQISIDREPQIVVNEETAVKTQETVVTSETDTLTDLKSIYVSGSKTIHHSESTTNIHFMVKQNEEWVSDKASTFDPDTAGHISTEREPCFEIVVSSETDTLTDHKTIQVSESNTIQVSELKTIHHSESTSNIHLTVKQNEECVDDKTTICNPFSAGHISTEIEPQFLIKEETVLRSHDIVVNSETDTLSDHKTIQVSESETIHNSESTSNIHLLVQQNEECLDDGTSINDSLIAGHISTKRDPQFLGKEENVVRSQEMTKEDTYQGETTNLNAESSIQRSCSQITENSDVWEDIQLFGEFRMQRKKSTSMTYINGSSHTQYKEEPHLPQQSKTSEESISDKKCAVFLAGSLSSHDFNKIIKAAENTEVEESPTVTFSKIYFITSTDLEMLQIMRPPSNEGFKGLSKNSIHLCTEKENSRTEDTSVINKTTTNTQSSVAILNMELADEKSIYKDSMSHGVALSDSIKETGILTMNENPKDHNAEGAGIEISKNNSKSEVWTEVTMGNDQELKTTGIVNTGYGMCQALKQTQTEQLQQASSSLTVEYIESTEMAKENLSEVIPAAAHTPTSRPQEQKLGNSKDLEIASNMNVATTVTPDSISHETDRMRFAVQHLDVQLSDEVLTYKTDKDTDPKTDNGSKSANNNHFQERKSKCLHIQQNEASSDLKATSNDIVVINQISTEKDLQFPVKDNNILATQKIKEEETNQTKEMKFNQVTESYESWETLQDFGEFRLQRKVSKHCSGLCSLSYAGQKEETRIEKCETQIRSRDMSHTQHAIFLTGILDVNESDKIFKAVARPHAEVIPPVTFKKIVFILPTDLEVVERMI